jgi:hypothetical protein
MDVHVILHFPGSSLLQFVELRETTASSYNEKVREVMNFWDGGYSNCRDLNIIYYTHIKNSYSTPKYV